MNTLQVYTVLINKNSIHTHHDFINIKDVFHDTYDTIKQLFNQNE